MKNVLKTIVGGFILGISLTGCSLDSDPTGLPPGKQFLVDLTDSPANYASMNVQIGKVEIFHDIRGWIQLHVPLRSVNILSLANGVNANIGKNDRVPPGHYSRVKLHFGPTNTVRIHTPVELNGIHYAAGSSVPLKWTPDSFYINLIIDKFVTNDEGARVLLDFDAEQSITETSGALLFAPVITEITDPRTGARGSVSGGSTAAFISFENDLASYSAYSTVEGRFYLRGMKEGVYIMTVRVLKRRDDGMLIEHRLQRDGIRVARGRITDVGVIRF